jgi:hypothetical protein
VVHHAAGSGEPDGAVVTDKLEEIRADLERLRKAIEGSSDR